MDSNPPYFKRSIADYFDRTRQRRGEDPDDDTTRALRIVLADRELKQVADARRERQCHQRIIRAQARKLEECRSANPLLFANPGDEVDLLYATGEPDMINTIYVGRAMLMPRPDGPATADPFVFQMQKNQTAIYNFVSADFIILEIHVDTPAFWKARLFEAFGWPLHGHEFKVVDKNGRDITRGGLVCRFLVIHVGQTKNQRIARVGRKFNPWCHFGPEAPVMPDGMTAFANLDNSSDGGSSDSELYVDAE
jgi:hypothetical protein